MDVFLVPTMHWDREWYRTFQAFRARLVDTIDRVLELMAADATYTFLLDGQTIVLEDYAEIRPDRRAELERLIGEGRIEIGPWYVQPDSLLPGGEAHVRNLLEGRRVGETFGPVTRVAYTPDSFGHPAQFPQLFAGFGLSHFVYWRGNSDEIAELPAEYAWVAPDGTSVLACHLWLGYGNAAGLPHDVDAAVKRLRRTVDDLSARTTSGRVLLLAGTDHQPPDAHTTAVCAALAAETGWNVRHASLTGFVSGLERDGRPPFTGELLGGKIANLLPSVWSTRTYLKLSNRACETALDGWAEPWAALGARLGCADERPAIRLAWRQLLQNQAHDSICGCSQDAVHEQMLARYAAAEELARETAKRSCERLAGLDVTRRITWDTEIDVAVFNPSPFPRTDVVRFPLQGFPPFDQAERRPIHPLNWENMRTFGYEVDGRAARVLPVHTHDRVRIINDQHDHDIEFVAEDIPAFGYKRFHLKPCDPRPDDEDDGRAIGFGDVSVRADPDGTFAVRLGDRTYTGLGRLEDIGDRGDTYDFDPVPWSAVEPSPPRIRRAAHASGLQHLRVERTLRIPRLADSREGADGDGGECHVAVVARVAPGVRRVDLAVHVDNRARDHRLRMLLPTGSPVSDFETATTFDVARRSTVPRDGSGWLHPAPATFPHQGFVRANGLTVLAPGLPEGEVRPDGVIAITLLRSVGWLSRMDLKTRPSHAGPALPTPGAQCLRSFSAAISLMPDADARQMRAAELGLTAVAAGDAPLLPAGTSLVAMESTRLVCTALKPAQDAEGIVLRVLNATDADEEAVIVLGFEVRAAVSVRLDEQPADGDVTLAGRELRMSVPAHSLRSVLLT